MVGWLKRLKVTRVAVYLDSEQQSAEDTNSQREGLWTKMEHPVHLAEPEDHFLVLGGRDVSAL